MNSSLASNADQPYGGKVSQPQDEIEHPAVNWAKLIFLIFLTFGLIVCMWEIWYFFLLWQSGYVFHEQQQRALFL